VKFIRNILVMTLEYFVLSSPSSFSRAVMSRKNFPWHLWAICFSGRRLLNGPVRITDSYPKHIGDNFRSVGFLLLGGNIVIGNNASLNNNIFLVGNTKSDGLVIGNNVLIGPNVVMRSSDHSAKLGELINKQGHIDGKIIIEDDVWIGANVVITRDVAIRRGAVVGAGAVVTNDIPENAIVGGAPAKVISYRQ
jgi:acetyltransferase-like isoleucine patch superfamily enzyme